MSDQHPRDEFVDPWGLPSEEEPADQWPDAVPGEAADEEPGDEGSGDEVSGEDLTPEPAPALEQEMHEPGEPPEEGAEDQTEEAVDQEEEGGTPETAQRIVEEAEEPHVDETHMEDGQPGEPGLDQSPEADTPGTMRPGPLSQALAAAQSVIGSLAGTPPVTEQHSAEEAEETETMGDETPPESPDTVEEATLESPQPTDGQPPPPIEGGVEGPVIDLPEEPPPWLVEEDVEVTNEGEATTASEDADLLEIAHELTQTDLPENSDASGELPPEGSPFEEAVEGELVIELADEEEAAPEEIARLVSELAGEQTADEDLEKVMDEIEVESISTDQTDHEAETAVQEVEETWSSVEEPGFDLPERGDEPDATGPGHERPGVAFEEAEQTESEDIRLQVETEAEEGEAEEEGDTTPSAYSELAAALGTSEPEPVDVEEEPQSAVRSGETPEAAAAPGVEWGALWKESAQGWVEDEEGQATWRPIVTTTPVLSDWEVDTYLGVVAGEVVLPVQSKDLASGIRSLVGGRSGGYEKDLARSRGAAVHGMVEEAVARGSHAVVGVTVDYEYLGGVLLVTASGTAVTLKTRG